MTILSVCQEVAPVVGIATPDAVFGSDDEDAIRLAALANEMGARIARAAEWQVLTRLRTLTGSDPNRQLPSDFDRFLQDGELRSNLWAGGALRHVTSRDEWLQMRLNPVSAGPPAWTLLGGEIHYQPAPQETEQISFYYVSNAWAQSAGGDNRPSFLLDADSYRLNERTLRLSMVAQWKANMGLDIGPHAGIASQALAEDIARDKGPREVKVGRARMPRDVTVAWPGVLG